MMGVLLLMGAVLVNLIAILIAFNAITFPLDQIGEEPFDALAQMRNANLLSACIRAVAALLAIPGLIFAVLGMIQFHHDCQGRG